MCGIAYLINAANNSLIWEFLYWILTKGRIVINSKIFQRCVKFSNSDVNKS